MSSAKRTPRYVEPIPRNLRIVGPTAEAQVIPIRRITPAYVPVVDVPTLVPPGAPARRRRAKPVGKRPWRVMIVSSTPGAPTRSFGVARWQARVMVVGLSIVLLVAAGSLAAFVTAFESPDLLVTSADAALLRDQWLDSRTRSTAARRARHRRESRRRFTPMLPGRHPASCPPRSRRAKPAPLRLLARTRARAGDPSAIALAPRSIEGLPVIGVAREQLLALAAPSAAAHPAAASGVDIAAPRGTRITAPAAGRVSSSDASSASASSWRSSTGADHDALRAPARRRW